MSTTLPYYENAKIECSTCGSIAFTGSTVQDMRIEVCSRCHPFYTGKQQLVDSAGRVTRFQRLLERGQTKRSQRSVRAHKKATKS